MKHTYFYTVLFAAALLFGACSKDISADKSRSNLISETFEATLSADDSTRTAVDGTGANVTWNDGDKVYYYTSDEGDLRSFTITSDRISAGGKSATLTLEREIEDTYYNLLYTGNTEPVLTAKGNTNMVFDGVKDQQDGTFSNANVSIANASPGGKGITFRPLTSIVKFSTSRSDIKTVILTGGQEETVAGNIQTDPTSRDVNPHIFGEGNKYVTATIAEPAAGTYYINIMPRDHLRDDKEEHTWGLVLTLKDESGNYIGHVYADKPINLENGEMINLGNIDSHINNMLYGLFSVGNKKQVSFSPGNLKYQLTGTPGWTFFDRQYAFDPGSGPGQYTSADYVSLFTWGYQNGVSTEKDHTAYVSGKSDGDNFTAAEDWGSRFSPGLRTLSLDEWKYLFDIPNNGTRNGMYSYGVTVAGASNCIVLYPDSWKGTIVANGDTTSYDTEEKWAAAEAMGAVCLPSARKRNGDHMEGSNGYYWTSTAADGGTIAYHLFFDDKGVVLHTVEGDLKDIERDKGLSVRLVKDYVEDM